MNHLAITQADGLALALLAVLALSFSFILLLVIAILRQRRRHNREVEELLEEMDQSEEDQKGVKADASDQPEAQPWERDSDWWKN